MRKRLRWQERTRARMQHYYRLHNGGGSLLFSFAMPGFRAGVVQSRASETVFEHCEPCHRVLITLRGGTAQTYAEAEGAAPVERADRAGSITVVPAGVRRRVLLRDGAMALVTMAIAPDFAIEDALGGEVRLLQNGRDDWLWRAGAAFEGAVITGAGTLELEGLAIAVARHLQRLSGRERRVATGLAPAALRRVLARMHDGVDGNLSLSDLAGECGLSVSAFGRAFRQSTGMTPHRYLTTQRMQRAMSLMRDARLPLASIAGLVGYSDQAHFTTAFVRHIGVPPARWRDAQLG